MSLIVNSTYQDVSSTSSNAVNLLNYAISQDSFHGSDYVIFCDEQSSYYIVWGDLVYEKNTVKGTDIHYIHYHRSTASGYSNYVYDKGESETFSLSSNNVNTSSLSGYGFKSILHEEYKVYGDVLLFLTLLTSFFFVMMINSLRRVRE